jgi:hypothetical protein
MPRAVRSSQRMRSADIKKFASVMAISSFHSQQERDEMKKATCFAHLFLRNENVACSKEQPLAMHKRLAFQGKIFKFPNKSGISCFKLLFASEHALNARAAVKIKPVYSGSLAFLY